MVLHGLEGSIKSHSSSPRDTATPGSHLTFPFADEKHQPPLGSVLHNVNHCVEQFHRRQKEESRCEFHLKLRHRVAGEEDLETVKTVLERVRGVLGRVQ